MEHEIEVRGADVTVARIRAQQAQIRDEIVNALREAVNAAEAEMRARVPKDSGKLASTIRKGGIIYSPGGLGGGGFYEVELIVGEGIPYLNVLVEGSGIHGQTGSRIFASSGNIREKIRPEWLPTTGATVMKFWPKDSPKPIYRWWVRGQRAQDEWITAAQEAAQLVIERDIAQFDMSHE